MNLSHVLLVDDDGDFCRYCRSALQALEDIRLSICNSCSEGMRVLEADEVDVLLADLELPDGSGQDLLKHAQTLDADPVVMLVTGKGTIQSALDAMKTGAFDYLLKPLPPLELRANVQKALSHRKVLLENRNLRRQLAEQRAERAILGNSPAIRGVLRLIDKVAPHDSSVLIVGESGVGKELVAQALHEQSLRRNAPFVALNCSALPETLLESELFGHQRGAFTGAVANRKGVFTQADGGTLFLDEIGSMPLGLQSKLLRVLEDGRVRPVGADRDFPVNVRVIAATNADLKQLIQSGKFREDLFFRLNIITIRVPPLRERVEDIAPLAAHFIERFSQGIPRRLAPEALKILEHHPWRGNVRELSNVLERACLLSEGASITAEHFPEELFAQTDSTASPPESSTLAGLERQKIFEALEKTHWHRSRAAELLGISRRTLYNKLRQYELSRQEESSS